MNEGNEKKKKNPPAAGLAKSFSCFNDDDDDDDDCYELGLLGYVWNGKMGTINYNFKTQYKNGNGYLIKY